jgi:hypothetical protein
MQSYFLPSKDKGLVIFAIRIQNQETDNFGVFKMMFWMALISKVLYLDPVLY